MWVTAGASPPVSCSSRVLVGPPLDPCMRPCGYVGAWAKASLSHRACPLQRLRCSAGTRRLAGVGTGGKVITKVGKCAASSLNKCVRSQAALLAVR